MNSAPAKPIVRPTGYVARCKCGVFTGAIDAKRTDRNDMAKIIGQWLFDGSVYGAYQGH